MSWSIDKHTMSFTCVGLRFASYASCATMVAKDPTRFGLDQVGALQLRAATYHNERTGRHEPGELS